MLSGLAAVNLISFSRPGFGRGFLLACDSNFLAAFIKPLRLILHAEVTNSRLLARASPRGGQTKMQIQARHKLKTMSPSPGPSNWRRSNVERNRL